MNSEQLLRVITIAIVVLLSMLLLGGMLKVAGFVLSFGFNALLGLLLIGICIRFYSIMKQKRY